VWRIPLIRDFVNRFMLRDDDGQVTLIDMGVKQSGPKVMAALASIGSGPSDVTRLMLTHAHPDHAGGAKYVADATGKEFGVHEADAEFVRSGTGPPRDRTIPLGGLFSRFPSKFPAAPVGETFTDGQVVPFAGGIQVVHTPGHSPGHASYLLRESGVLITGDAIFNVRGLRWPVKAFCTDFRMTTETAVRLTELEYTTAAFTHGPHLSDHPRDHIRRFLQQKGMI
jgi:glyoxylase-like metal-dependent hydrolase (beta-lactamase superfamily II)